MASSAHQSVKRPNALLEGPILKSPLTLAIPVVFANILQSAYQLIDTFWVGRLGGAAVAAVSVSFPVMFLMIALGMGLAMVGSTLTAQYRGAGNDSMVAHVAGQTLIMVAGMSVILSVVGYIAAPALLRLMGVAPDVYDGALGFMRVSFVALLFNFVFFVFQSIMRGVGRPVLAVYIVARGFMGVQLALTGVLRASGNIVAAMTITLVSPWVIQFPLAYVLATHTSLGSSGIWWAFPISIVVTAAIVVCVYARGNWKHTRLIRPDDKATAKITREAELEEPMR